MKNTWFIWIFVVGVVITVIVAFNYQGTQQRVPLSEIFPEEETYPIDVEYEFIDEKQAKETAKTKMAEGMKEAGSQTVRVDPTEIAAAQTQVEITTQQAQAQSLNGNYVIQVASFKEKIRADELLKSVKEKGFPAYIMSKNLGDKGTWYRVYIGNYENNDSAKQVLIKVQTDYKNSFVVKTK